MKPAISTLFPLLLAAAITLANGDSSDQTGDDLCRSYMALSPEQKMAVVQLFGEPCTGGSGEIQMEKRKPNFIRFGRSGSDNTRPNFLRFGRNTPNFLRFGRPDVPNFLRFGRAGTPNFLRFGRDVDDLYERAIRKPNFIRFGRSVSNDADLSPNFLRFGRSADDDFDRAVRKPNFLRHQTVWTNVQEFEIYMDNNGQMRTETVD